MTAHRLARPILPAAVAETTRRAAAPVPPPAPLVALAGRGRLRIGFAPDADARLAGRLAAAAERVAKARAALAAKVGDRDIPGMLRDAAALGDLTAALVLEHHAAVMQYRDDVEARVRRRLDAIETRLDRLDTAPPGPELRRILGPAPEATRAAGRKAPRS